MNRYKLQPWVPTNPIVANLFIDEFEAKAISKAHSSQDYGSGMYVHDTFVIQKVEHSHQFLQHINYITLHIQFIAESSNTDESIFFLDTLISPGLDN